MNFSSFVTNGNKPIEWIRYLIFNMLATKNVRIANSLLYNNMDPKKNIELFFNYHQIQCGNILYNNNIRYAERQNLFLR